jgi:hypothetical protein
MWMPLSVAVRPVKAIAKSPGESGLIQDDDGIARARYEETLMIARELDQKPTIARALLDLARVAQAQGDHEKMRALLDESPCSPDR